MPVKPIPDGAEGIIPHLIVDNAAKAIEFYQQAFGAELVSKAPTPDGKKLMHAELKIGKSRIYLNDDFPEYSNGKSRTPMALGGSPVVMHRYVEDCDTIIKRAEKAGAKVTMPPQDQFWGDRYGTIRDPFGHVWSFATHVKDVTPDEMAKAMEEAFAHAPK